MEPTGTKEISPEATSIGVSGSSHLKQINEELYKQNLELAVKNKTLSLLRELYEISILNLDPKDLSQKIALAIQSSLSLELLGILLYQASDDELIPLTFAESDRFKIATSKLTMPFIEVKVSKASQKQFFAPLIGLKQMVYTENLSDLWGGIIDPKDIERLEQESHIKSSLVYPLKIEHKLIGVLVLSLNRTYESLNQHEQESINSFINVIAVALDRSMVHEKLKSANKRLKELDELKSEFMSLATHQIRSPLTAIKGYTSLMLEEDYGKLPPAMIDPLKVIYQSCDSLIKIVGEFLDISRIEQGRMKYEHLAFDFKKLVEESAHEFKPTIDNSGLEFKLDIAPGDYKLNGDITKLKQVINNLIDNALKYTKQGSVTVSLEHPDQLIRLKVADTGIGLSPENITKLFSKFTRLRNAAKSDVMGTGLGLYVAKEIVEGHHGKVWAESEGEGQGATFVVELPINSG